MQKSIKAYPLYSNDDLWELGELVACIQEGSITDFIMTCLCNKDDFLLGTLSMPLTKPVNGMTIDILIDLNAANVEADDRYFLRVNNSGDGFIDIKNDIEFIEMAIAAIKNNTMPLYNVTKNIDYSAYQYVALDD